MISLPKLVQVPSPNYSSRNGAKVRLIIVHCAQGSYAGAVSWFTQTVSKVSSHLVMKEDGSEVTQMVPLSEKAWHVCNLNSVSIGIEGAGIMADGFSDAWWRGMASIVAWLLHRYGLPCRWAQKGEGEGFASHHDLLAAGGNHTDPCAIGAPQWMLFIGMVQSAYQEFSAGSLPDWALHGLPAPLTISPPPEATGETSHGGVAGKEPQDVATPAIVGSTLWVQQSLVTLGIDPALECDGLDGILTKRAVAAFQHMCGLNDDGIAGSLTISALERALAKHRGD